MMRLVKKAVVFIEAFTPGVIFFFNDTATTEIYTLSLHDALPISGYGQTGPRAGEAGHDLNYQSLTGLLAIQPRSEEHTSELQSRPHLVCRLLLEKKKNKKFNTNNSQKKKKKYIT